MLALSLEALLQVGLCDESGIVDIEMMEGEGQVSLCNCLSAINGNSKELSVIDLTIVIEINSLEDLIDLLFGHIQFTEGSPDLAKLKCARVVYIECAEGVP